MPRITPVDWKVLEKVFLFNGGLIWRINYGPKDYVGRRGGDLIVDVDPGDASVKQVLRGQ